MLGTGWALVDGAIRYGPVAWWGWWSRLCRGGVLWLVVSLPCCWSGRRSGVRARLAYLAYDTPPVGGSCGSGGMAMAPRRTTAKTADEVREAREAKLTELSERLEGAVGRLVSGEDWAAAVRFAARFRSRSFANTLLIFAQHQDAFEQGRVSEPF